MPSFSATEPATKSDMAVATSTSHPSAAATSVSYHPAITSARRGFRSSAVDGSIRSHERSGRPNGTSGMPTRASISANSSSGGAHTRASAPSARSCTASATIGSTSPRDPYVDNNTRTSRPPFPRALASAGILRHRPPRRQCPALAWIRRPRRNGQRQVRRAESDADQVRTGQTETGQVRSRLESDRSR